MANYLLNGQETDRIIFSAIDMSHFDQWLEFFKTPETTLHWIANYEAPEMECRKWYEKQFNRYATGSGGMNALIEKASGRLIGHCGLLKQTVDGISELEIGYSLLPQFWNRGYATEAAKKCREYAFENKLSGSLISIISLTNLPSETVARKNGMTLDKTTFYNGNEVNIFRIKQEEWR
nr:GNAT family N-acetyltransferase [uncultured Lacibacter sp.]